MDITKSLKVASGKEIKLSQFDPNGEEYLFFKPQVLAKLSENLEKLKEYQEALFAEQKQSLLVLFQAIDAGGKDGTIKHVFGPLNPAGCIVSSFKVPSSLEMRHDFLWRIHAKAPAKGEIAVFNRSHYEKVLVERVHKLEPEEINKKRYEQINEYEKFLTSENTHILKFFLHISKDEQLERFKARIDKPSKHWKLSISDYAERNLWDDYMAAFENMLSKCSTDYAPWFIIPSNHKWFRDYAISEILVDYFENMKIGLPETTEDIEEIKQLYAAELAKQNSNEKVAKEK